MRWLVVFGALALVAQLAPAAHAQEEVGEEEARARIPHYDALKEAARLGRELFRYDQAAWHATDSLLEKFDTSNSSLMRGYIVLPRDDDGLDAVFYGEVDGKLVEVARYTVDGNKVVGGGLLPEHERPPLPELAVRMAAARQTAMGEMRAQEYGLCANSAPNTIVLPPDKDGTIVVYILTPPTSNESYPVGGHFRFEVGSDGKVLRSRRFLNTCFEANFGPQKQEGSEEPVRPEALVMTHLLDPQPTEIHVFASFYIPVMMMIATTENEEIWSVNQGAVGYMGSLDDARRERDQ